MGVLKQAEGGVPVAALCREHGMSSASFYKWDGRAFRLLNVLDCQIASNSDPLFASNFAALSIGVWTLGRMTGHMGNVG